MSKTSSITVGQFGRPVLSRDGRTMVVRIPISFRKQRGRKRVMTPANTPPWTPKPTRVDSTIVKAIVRAHRWRKMLESGRYGTLRDLANVEKINEAYLGRVLRLTLLSPSITETILSGRQPDGLELARLLMPFPVEWKKQEKLFLQ